MAANIYNFLDSILSAVRISESLTIEAQERDQVDLPEDIQPGGYSNDIFIFLSEKEKDEYNCSICYSVIKDAHQCSNSHRFCYTCIYVWSRCNRAGADNCPTCRCDGIYARNNHLNEKIENKRVKCQDGGCNWRGFLRHYNDHDHRHYKFKELSRCSEFSTLKGKSMLDTTSKSFMNSSELMDDVEYIDCNYNEVKVDSNGHNTDFINSNQTNDISRHDHDTQNNSDALRISKNSDLRSDNPLNNYHHGFSYSPDLSSLVTINRLSDLDHQTNGNTAELAERLDLNASIQTSASDNIEDTDIIDSFSTNEISSFPRLLNETREADNSLFSLSNRIIKNNSGTNELQTMEYRRLAPTFASRRRNLGFLADDGENLALILLLLTSDLEDTSSSQTESRNSLSTMSSRRTISNRSSSDSLVQQNNSRLRDIRNLNVRLSEVENRLDSLLDSSLSESDSMVELIRSNRRRFEDYSEDE